ncbi:hypothetical protein IOCL2690_000809000, partial [Leishmania lindenbergi]
MVPVCDSRTSTFLLVLYLSLGFAVSSSWCTCDAFPQLYVAHSLSFHRSRHTLSSPCLIRAFVFALRLFSAPRSRHAYDRVRVLPLRGAPRPRPPVRALRVPVHEAGADLLAPEVLRAVHAQEEPEVYSVDAHVPPHPPQDDDGPREPPPRCSR